MFPIIDIGPLAIQAAGLTVLLSLWIGIWVSIKFAKNLGTNGDAIETAILYALLAGIIGARIGFLLQNPVIFQDNPLSLISLTPSMLDASFGFLIAGLTLFIIYQKKHLPLWPTLDTITPLILFLFVGLHLADYANGDNYGLETSLPWGIELWNAVRHPVQLYVFLLILFLLIWLLIQTRAFKITGFQYSGILFSIVVACLAFITIFARAFIAEKSIFFGIDLVQMIAFLVLALSFYLIYVKAFKTGKPIPVFLSLGANQNAIANLTQAQEMIAEKFQIRSSSSLYQTRDVREGSNRQYFNQVIKINVDLPFSGLLTWCKDLEKEFGRKPGDKNNVPLDVDIIVYNGDVFNASGKQIPDPNLNQFNYIAVPLAEIDPAFRHPATGQSIQDILAKLEKSGQSIEKRTEVENGTQR